MTEKATAGQEAENTPNLDVIMRDGLEQFDVIPPNNPQDEPGSNAAPLGLSEPSPSPKAPPAAPEASPAPNNAAAPPETGQTIEQRYKALEAAFTTKSQKLAELEAKINAERETHERAEAQNLAATEFETFAAERRATLLNEIDALDPDAEDYRVQVAKLQAKCDRDILLASQKVVTPAPRAAAASPNAAADTPAAPTREEIIAYVRQKITTPEIGLAPDDRYFWMMCSQAPEAKPDGTKATLDDQIAWAAEQTKQYHAQIMPNPPGAPPAPDPAQIAAQVNALQPLSRGGAPPAPNNQPTERDKPMSLSEAIEEANNLRRL
jgi:hypothetical protein